ncbi:MAG: deoxyguanosinetriphosphate triphosphohydrolase [Victivallaceae bacterium]|nr:deoxyguanosinetriphosphate triphosphohydrolase [Victivallaceae bacterium]
MDWIKLLSLKRLGKQEPDMIMPGRSPFQQDFDRIVFSSAFRRMQDKAQVFPLAENDNVRTRLTHSLECSCVARSLGAQAGVLISELTGMKNIQPSDVGAVVAAAALAHDIGNTPLGHSGEEAIRHWFCNSAIAVEMRKSMNDKECADIERYEGNAQGFRVLARLQMPDNPGGMQLTCATLATFAKYPVESYVESSISGISAKKFNFFQQDRELFTEVAETTGLDKLPGEDYCWKRHPLVFLVEAADDICYNIVDFEDSYRMGIIDFAELRNHFCKIIDDPAVKYKAEKLSDRNRQVEMLRAKALGKLIGEVSIAFEKYHDTILAGELNQPLIELIDSKAVMAKIIQRSIDDIYTFKPAVEIEAAGFELIKGLLDVFVCSVNDIAENSYSGASYRSRKLMLLLPDSYWKENVMPDSTPYNRLLGILDYIAGMTDSYAVSLFKKIRGISLPGR